MTQEEKQLLLIDLCARLPYSVKGLHRGEVHDLFTIDGREANSACIQVDGYDAWFPIETFKPYLRPMSSMTAEERRYYNQLSLLVADGDCNIYEETDWLNEHHFDYRGLIEKGIALEAPDDMYN